MLCTVYALYILVCPSRWGITRYPNWLPFISGKMMIMFGTSNQLDTSSHHEIKKKMASQFVKTPIYNCWFWMVISAMGKCGFHNSSIFIICKNCVWCTPVTFQESHRHIFWCTPFDGQHQDGVRSAAGLLSNLWVWDRRAPRIVNGWYPVRLMEYPPMIYIYIWDQMGDIWVISIYKPLTKKNLDFS